MKLEIALAFVMFVNVFLFLSQVSADNIALEQNLTPPEFFNYEGSLVSNYDAGNGTYVLDENVTNKLPTGEGTVEDGGTGNFFTDVFQSIRNWFLETTGLKYLLAIVNAVPNFLETIGLPDPMPFALGALWHSITLFMVVAWLAGRI